MPVSVCLKLLNPFVEAGIWQEVSVSREIVLVLCINFFINGTRRAVLIFKESMGLFWYDRYRPIAEAILNLGISFCLGYTLWVVGVF